MQIYTLVSLLLGIVGATYAASNAFRTQFEERIKNARDGSKNVDLGKFTINVKTLPKIKCAQWWVNFWHWFWIGSHLVPAILLNFFVFLIIGSSVLQWKTAVAGNPQDLDGYPWCYARILVSSGWIIGVGCIIISFLSKNRIIFHSNKLDDLVVASGVKDTSVETPTLTPPIDN